MLIADQFEQLVEKIRKLELVDAQLEGNIEQVLDELEREFGVRTLADSQEIMETLQTERNEILSKYNKAHDAFMKRWGDKL